MWTLDDAMHALDRALDSPAATALALLTLLAVPLAATSGIGRATHADARPAMTPAPMNSVMASVMASATAPAAAGYRLRCWQQGRLLFEQALAAPPVDAAGYTLQVRGNDRDGRPVFLAETAQATCRVERRDGARDARTD